MGHFQNELFRKKMCQQVAYCDTEALRHRFGDVLALMIFFQC